MLASVSCLMFRRILSAVRSRRESTDRSTGDFVWGSNFEGGKNIGASHPGPMWDLFFATVDISVSESDGRLNQWWPTKRRKHKRKLQVFDLLTKQAECYVSNATVWILKKYSLKRSPSAWVVEGGNLVKDSFKPFAWNPHTWNVLVTFLTRIDL